MTIVWGKVRNYDMNLMWIFLPLTRVHTWMHGRQYHTYDFNKLRCPLGCLWTRPKVHVFSTKLIIIYFCGQVRPPLYHFPPFSLSSGDLLCCLLLLNHLPYCCLWCYPLHWCLLICWYIKDRKLCKMGLWWILKSDKLISDIRNK